MRERPTLVMSEQAVVAGIGDPGPACWLDPKFQLAGITHAGYK